MGQCGRPWHRPGSSALLVVFLGRGAGRLGAGAVDRGVRAGHGRGDRRLYSTAGDRGSVSQGFQHGYPCLGKLRQRSEEHTSELQSLMCISYAVFCLKKKKNKKDIGRINKTITNST